MPPRTGSRNRNGYLVPIGPDGELRPLQDLPRMIADAEARGHPVIINAEPGSLDEPHQRLYAVLGVLVRYVPPRTA